MIFQAVGVLVALMAALMWTPKPLIFGIILTMTMCGVIFESIQVLVGLSTAGYRALESTLSCVDLLCASRRRLGSSISFIVKVFFWRNGDREVFEVPRLHVITTNVGVSS